jgi:hypothetical protein
VNSASDKQSVTSLKVKETDDKPKAKKIKTGKVNKDNESILKSRLSEKKQKPNKDLYYMISKKKSSKGGNMRF